MCRFSTVGLGIRGQLDTRVEQPLPDLTNVGEVGELLLVLRKPRIERQDVLFEHPLEESDHGCAVHHDDVVLTVPTADLEAELLIERDRDTKVLDGEADRKRAELHAFLLSGSASDAPEWAYAAFRSLLRSLNRINC